MKICVINAAYNLGGASEQAFSICESLVERGHRVMFICAGTKDQSFLKNKYRVRILGQKYRNPIYHYFNPNLIRKLYILLKQYKPDIVHFHNINLQSFSLCSLLFSRLYPLVWTLHDLWPLCMTGWPSPPDCNQLIKQCYNCPTWPATLVRLNKLLKETIFRHSNLNVVCPSNWLANLLTECNLNINPIHVIFNGISPSLFSPCKKNNGNRSKKILLFCGGKKIAGQLPAERKGWNYLVSALKKLVDLRTDIKLLYVGDPIKLLPSFPVPVSFEITSERKKMAEYYGVADLFILPTLADNSPLTVIEAMASKVPVIATDAGGISDMIISNETGMLCPPRDATALAEKIDYALSNPAHSSELAEKAYQRFKKFFTLERMIDQYEDVYMKTIADRKN